VRHEVGEKSEDHGNARHFFWRVGPVDRIEHTASVISADSTAIVFCRTRHGADKVAKRLEQLGVRAEAIHGGRSQVQRTRALKAFSDGRVWALVATDVAARGIHVTGVACVIHFDPADDAKAYLHRSGRTARAGAPGVVLSMVTDDQTGMIRGLQRSIGMSAPLGDPDPAGLATGGHRVGTTAPKAETGASRRSPNRGGGGKSRSRTKTKSRHQYWG
jgi:superfamily II DNA/RNA helicase